MNSAKLNLVACCVGLLSCTTSKPLLGPTATDEINRRARTQTAHVFLQDPGAPVRGPIAAVDLRIGTDSVSWIDPASYALHSAPTTGLYKVTFSDHLRGVFDGAGVGAAGGVVLGGVVGLLLIDSSSTADAAADGLAFTAAAAVVLGAVGVVAGAIGGGISGSTIAYVRTYEDEATISREHEARRGDSVKR